MATIIFKKRSPSPKKPKTKKKKIKELKGGGKKQ